MKQTPTLLIILLLVGAWLVRPALAQPVLSSNRFLFIVETSKAMKLRLPAAARSVEELLATGLGGQLRAGDTIGLWTYDSELHAGIFPMAVWQDGKRAMLAEAMTGYLKQHKTKGRARLEQVLPEVLRLVEGSAAITVLLYTDGTEPVRGTPFDDSINGVFKEHQKELADAHIPFVTVLVGRGGKIVKCNVNSAVGVSVPELPMPGQTNKPTTARPAVPVAKPLPLRTNASLVVDYSKSNLVKSAASTTAVVRAEEAVPTNPPMVVLRPLAPASAPEAVEPASVAPVETPGTNVAEPPVAPVAVTQVAAVAAPPQYSPVTSAPVVLPPAAVKEGVRAGWVWVVAGLAVLLVVGLGIILRAGRSAKSGGSLITKSFDRKK